MWMSDEHEGWSAVVRRDGELVGKARRCRYRWLSQARGGVDYHLCWRGRSGAEMVCSVDNGLCS